MFLRFRLSLIFIHEGLQMYLLLLKAILSSFQIILLAILFCVDRFIRIIYLTFFVINPI
jgi:hypothetical protein